MPAATREARKQQIIKKLLKRPQTLAEIADKIGHGATVKGLARPAGELLRSGQIVAHSGRPPKYSKPAEAKS